MFHGHTDSGGGISGRKGPLLLCENRGGDVLDPVFITGEDTRHGSLYFSEAVPHGDPVVTGDTVMMTLVKGDRRFLHAPDIQLLWDRTVSEIGFEWIDRLSEAIGKPVYCAADFMGEKRAPLEAERDRLYRRFPVPGDWHANYAKGHATTENYRHCQ